MNITEVRVNPSSTQETFKPKPSEVSLKKPLEMPPEIKDEQDRSKEIKKVIRELDALKDEERKEEGNILVDVQHSKQRRNFAEKIRDKLLYPSAKDVAKVFSFSVGGGIAINLGTLMGAPSEVTLPLSLASLGLVTLEYALVKLRTIKVTDFMKLTKIASPTSRVFPKGHQLKKGDIIGELHIGNARIERKFRPLGKYQRGMAVEKEATAGLNTLATLCNSNDERVKGIEVFYGRSDLIRGGGLLKRLGFEVETHGPLGQSFVDRIVFRMARIRALGVKEGISAPIGLINEAWITRENLGKLAK